MFINMETVPLAISLSLWHFCLGNYKFPLKRTVFQMQFIYPGVGPWTINCEGFFDLVHRSGFQMCALFVVVYDVF